MIKCWKDWNMERLQIRETPSIPLQGRQIPISQGAYVAWYRLLSSTNWRWYASWTLVVSTLLVILFVVVNGSHPDQRAAHREERIVKLTAAIRDTPADPALYWMLGDAYFDQEDYAQALANYHRYLELAPANPPQRLLQRLTYLEFHILKK
jgi:cytochrome c-type biogenesis protein CcmH/NrfG